MQIDSSTISALGLDGSNRTTPASKSNSLKIDDFLKLLTTQLTHQDPTKPADSSQFLTQIAQIGTVTGIQDLQRSFSDFSSSISSDQALQASSLVGRSVSIESNLGLLPAGGELKGDFDLTGNTTNASVKIINSQTGETVRTINLGSRAEGSVPFVWDGLDDDGTLANPGLYRIQASATIDGKNTDLATQVAAKVDSVTVGSSGQGLQLNLQGLGTVDFNKVKQII
ncbi:MAG: flagellar hook capping protein [Methylobacter sp.]|nr:MAG: flagellar hook capping protein [Methylobacter sp.]PPD19227.1 MAG: flagellar hook capping protein [Methylobacter sp.]PPD36825.1 MAG: flagellar hook capping protein [Methylomonas sp.]